MAPPWTPDAVQAILADPTYVGMGSYRAIVAEEKWIAANVRMIEEQGSEVAIKNILDRFQDRFSYPRAPKPGPYIQQAMCDPHTALHRLLADLRKLVDDYHRN